MTCATSLAGHLSSPAADSSEGEEHALSVGYTASVYLSVWVVGPESDAPGDLFAKPPMIEVKPPAKPELIL